MPARHGPPVMGGPSAPRAAGPTVDAWPPVVISEETSSVNLATAILLAEISRRQLTVSVARRWFTTASAPGLLRQAADRVVFEWHQGRDQELTLEWGDCLVNVAWMGYPRPRRLVVTVCGSDRLRIDHLLDEIDMLVPAVPEPDDGTAKVVFWSRGRHSTEATVKRVASPHWDEIARNYPSSTRDALLPLMTDLDAVAARGRLLLWHGPPGVGKTWALRALAREHPRSAVLDYIVEPEIVFGAGSHNLTAVLHGHEDDHHDDEEDHEGSEREAPWRIVVLEDTDELLSVDAKERAGQGMARLLNLTDGLLGQAHRVLVLITTNEPLSSFHPAVVRPGRCGALVSFRPFTAAEATEWLGAPVDRPRSLAELFALRDGCLPAVETAPAPRLGFRVGR